MDKRMDFHDELRVENSRVEADFCIPEELRREIAASLKSLFPVWRLGVALAILTTAVSWAGDSLSWRQEKGYRFAPLPRLESGRVGFSLLPASGVGIGFTNRLDDRRSVQNRNLLSGSGVALGDMDGDGLCDLYFCGLDSKNRLYRNLGSWRFEDVTLPSGLDLPAQDSTGAAFADVDGNGSLDLFVNALGHGTRLFLNDGRGHF